MKLENEVMKTVYEYSQRPEPFAKGTGNIWTDPYLANQMLEAHLNKDCDAASRKEETIDRTITYLKTVFASGSSILDLGCGPGLYASRLAKIGYQMTGVDFSKNSLRYAREDAKKKGLSIQYRQSDFLELDYPNQFDNVMQIYGELNTFSDKDRDKLFQIILRSLKLGGKFVFDITSVNQRKNSKETMNWYSAKGGFFRPEEHIVLESVLPYENDIWLEQYIVIDDEKVTVYRNWYHEYTPQTIKEVLLKAGFGHVEVQEKLYGQELPEANWLTVVATK